RKDFRDELRSAFVDGSLAAEPDPREVLGPRLDDAFRAWPAPTASAAARDSIRARFLTAGAADAERGDSVPGERDSGTGHQLRPVAARGPRSTRRHGAGARSRAAESNAPGPARAQRRRLQLVAGGGILLAAAALLFTVVVPLGRRAGDDAPTTTTVASAAWTVEPVAAGDAPMTGLLVDGESRGPGTPALDGWRRLEAGPDGLRIRRGEDYVLELGPRSVVEFSEGDGAGVVRLSEGELRVATGPAFEPGALVLESPHVRAEVTGTILGFDVGEDYTCVCCLEGEVRTEPLLSGADARSIGGGSTRVVAAALGGGHPFDTMPLVPHHAEPLRGLADYWG
ncbi:MAG: FecR domain-containing protein, partial [Planctomycetota bacterium]